MKTKMLAATAVVLMAINISAASATAMNMVNADLNLPEGAVYSSLPQRLHIQFPDGSTYLEMPTRLDINGKQAVTWFINNLPSDDPQKLVKPEDVLSFLVLGNPGNVVRMEIEYRDHSRYIRIPGREDVTGPLASYYTKLIRVREREMSKQPAP